MYCANSPSARLCTLTLMQFRSSAVCALVLTGCLGSHPEQLPGDDASDSRTDSAAARFKGTCGLRLYCARDLEGAVWLFGDSCGAAEALQLGWRWDVSCYPCSGADCEQSDDAGVDDNDAGLAGLPSSPASDDRGATCQQ